MSAQYKIVLDGLSGSKLQKQNSSRTGFTACIGNLVAGRYLLLVVTYMECHDPIVLVTGSVERSVNLSSL